MKQLTGMSRRARWAVPAGAVVVVGGVLAGSLISVAQAAPGLPAKTPAQLAGIRRAQLAAEAGMRAAAALLRSAQPGDGSLFVDGRALSCELLKEAIEGRIRALANVHSLFVETRWIGADLSTIAEQELAPYVGTAEKRVSIDGLPILLEPNTAQSIAVTLHELATNAAKYGALSAPGGRIVLAWMRGADGRLTLRWTESGGPPARTPERQGFGSRIIGLMMTQLKGETRFDWRPEGLVCEMAVSV